MGDVWERPACLFLWLSSSFLLDLLGTPRIARSQITPDNTLPDNTVVIPNGNTSQIEGGTRIGGNLFHSFGEFSVLNGNEAFFNNAADVDNILSRVTGENVSLIDGLIRTNGNANLFLINPQGIVFGSNAQLNIGGSFIGSTANSIRFADGSQFSAIEPQAPPLLTINIPIGLQFGANPAPIVNQSVAESLLTPNLPTGLENSGKTLALVGGDLILDGGNLTARQGRIELGSVASPGLVSLTPTTNGLTLDYQGIQNFGNIELTDAAAVNVSGLGGGTIRVQGGQVTLTENSHLVAETFGNLNGGGIEIQATQFQLQDQAFVSTSTFGAGTGGNLAIRANTVELTGTTPLKTIQQLLTGTFNPLNLSDGLFSLSGGSGAAGDLTIDAGQLILQNGANVLTSALVSGGGGNLTLAVSELTQINNGSLLLTGTAGTGDAGDLAITTKQLRVFDGSTVTTASNSTSLGRGGDLTVTADLVELKGTPPGSAVPSGLFTTTLGAGDAGDLTINTQQLLAQNGAQVSAASSGAGTGGSLRVNAAESVELSGLSNDGRWLSGLYTTSSLLEVIGQTGSSGAGELTVNTQRLIVQDGARVSAATGGQGKAGSLLVNASESVRVSGIGNSPFSGLEPSALFANSRGSGGAGDLMIQTGQLIVDNGASIAVNGQGNGDAGDLKVTADSILLGNQGSITAINTSGSGGDIELNARSVQLNNGVINASVLGNGTGGDITIRAPESVEVIGDGLAKLIETIFSPALAGTIKLDNTRQGIVTATAGAGAAGSVSIETGHFRMQNGGLIATTTLGEGTAGDVNINAPESVEITSSFVATSTLGSGAGGDIEIDTRRLLVQEVGVLSTTTLSSGKAGNLSIRASESVEVTGSSPDSLVPTNLTAGTPLPTTGDGGDISITTPKLTLSDGADISVSSEGSGNAGNITAKVSSLALDNGEIAATSNLGEGGDIYLQVQDDLVLRNQSRISTRAGTEDTGGGNGGNMTIDAKLIVAFAEENSDITANAFQGSGGNIKITANGVFGLEERAQPTPLSDITASSQLGIDGLVVINRPDVNLSTGLVELPTEVVDITRLIATGCGVAAGSSFVVTGRGGLPLSPTEVLRGSTVWQDLRPLSVSEVEDTHSQKSPIVSSHSPIPNPQSPIVKAQGWVKHTDGTVELVAYPTTDAPQRFSPTLRNCYLSQEEFLQ